MKTLTAKHIISNYDVFSKMTIDELTIYLELNNYEGFAASVKELLSWYNEEMSKPRKNPKLDTHKVDEKWLEIILKTDEIFIGLKLACWNNHKTKKLF